MAKTNNIEQQLYDNLVSQGFHPDMLDRMGKPANTAEDAKTFKFDYVSGTGKDYGTMVIIITPDNELQVLYGDNLGRAMDPEDKDDFFQFQQYLSKFARMHRYNFTAKDIGQLKYSLQGLAAIQEGLFEGYYGNRKTSYMGEATQARLMIRHNRDLGEGDARYRYVESLFIETQDGERFRLPFTNLSGGRAMLEHVRQGGRPYDIRGNHITEMINEMKLLSRFNRASHGRVVEGVTAELVNEAFAYYENLRRNIKHLGSSRGYVKYFESWSPADFNPQDQLVENIKTLFVEQHIDSRIEDALPLLAKIQKESTAMKELEIFENWATQLSEGTWALPETPEQKSKLEMLLSKELIAGPDGENATQLLYDLVGDDTLFDIIDQVANQDPDTDLMQVPEFVNRLEELGITVPQPQSAAPAPEQQPQPTAEADLPTYGESLGMAVVGEGACNMTAEGEHCPVHGLKECGYMEEQGVSEGHADQQRKIFKRNGRPVGEVGIDRESSPGAGQWYMKCYAYDIDNGGYDSYEEAVAELKHCLKQGVSEDLPAHIKPSDLPPAMRNRRLTMRDIEKERPQGAYRFRVGEKEFMDLAAAKQFAAGTGQQIQPIREDDAMEYNAAITGSFYEGELDRIKKLALSK